MISALKRVIKRVVLRRLLSAYFRVRDTSLQDESAIERLCRRDFFNRAFKALMFNGIDGDYVEFGCWSGVTFGLAYHESRRQGHMARLWAFDSFCGLPSPQGPWDEHPSWKKGAMATSVEQFHEICKSNGIPRDAYTIVPGFYNETLEKMSHKEAPTNICLAYIDCDLYSSTKSVFEFLMPRLKHGMIIALDDYYCWSANQIAGERRALFEFFENNEQWHLLPYIQYGWHGASFIVESKLLLTNKNIK
jgi:hypothetical protein